MENKVIDRRRKESSTVPASAAGPGGPVPAAKKQAELFEKAIALFNAGEFETAKSLFQEAGLGPLPQLTHAALLHARMCDRRLSQSEPTLKSAEDHYNYAITLINERRMETAERHLLQAVIQLPEGDHIYYALALCRGLSGDLSGAHRHLRKALELQPRNRALARNDPDFADIGKRSPLRELLYPEKQLSQDSRAKPLRDVNE